MAISKKKLKEMYLKMMQTRKFEEKAANCLLWGRSTEQRISVSVKRPPAWGPVAPSKERI